MRAFVETSALIKRYHSERGSDALDEMVAFVKNSGGDLFISNLVALEVVGCFAKKLRRADIEEAEYLRLVERFEIDYHDLFAVVRLIDDRLTQAFKRAIAEPQAGIDAADRLHVEAARDVMFSLTPQPTAFITSDRSLYGYAQGKGLHSWDPERDGLEQLVKIRSQAEI